MSVSIGINGMGVLGRQFLRTIIADVGGGAFGVRVSVINDPFTTPEMLKYLLMTDSVYGNQTNLITSFGIQQTEDSNIYNISINGMEIHYTMISPNNSSPTERWSKIPWGQWGTEVVVDCIGLYLTSEEQRSHVERDDGAKKVIVCGTNTGLFDNETLQLVNGVNTFRFKEFFGESVYACPSGDAIGMCTIASALLQYGLSVDNAIVEFINSYTNLNNLQDSILKTVSDSQMQMGRAGAWNIIPCATNIGQAIGFVIPELNGKVLSIEHRSGTIAGSHVDIIVRTKDVWKADDFYKLMGTYETSDVYKAIASDWLLLHRGISNNVPEFEKIMTVTTDVINSPFVMYDVNNYDYIESTTYDSNSYNLLRVGGVYDAIKLQIMNVMAILYLYQTLG